MNKKKMRYDLKVKPLNSLILIRSCEVTERLHVQTKTQGLVQRRRQPQRLQDVISFMFIKYQVLNDIMRNFLGTYVLAIHSELYLFVCKIIYYLIYRVNILFLDKTIPLTTFWFPMI